MKLRSLLCTLMILFSAQLYTATDKNLQSLRISFCSNKNQSVQAFNLNQEDLNNCVELLTYYANIQKQRKLTLEEMTVIMQIIMFLFANTSNQHTQHIEILLNNTDKLLVPYSSQLFAAITQQQTENQ